VGDAERICAAAKSNAPVDIQALRDSGHVEKASGTASAEFDIVFDPPVKDDKGSYASYVEEGASKMAAEPDLRPAILAGKD